MLKFSRLSAHKIRRIILCFCEDIIASSASKLLKINRNTIN
ncbi:MAG: IS1595 family transposase, partial [Holosporaceae bacterium]|nr:IS1595 family transposase [Holosporaceae bacterium]